jgi:N-acyl-D-aspartate/D-glutamate deacylase
MTFDLLLRGGIVVDGTRMPRRAADVAIAHGRIAKVGRVSADDAEQVIDVDGQIIAPGFIDLHTHYDAQVFWDPYCSLSGWHGVTSVVIGNCGFGFAPVRAAERDRAMLSMTRVEAIPMGAMQKGMPWDWETFPEFLDSVDRAGKAVNVLAYVPISALLIWVLGLERAKAGDLPSPSEHAEMKRLLHEAMDAGARGWSAQWMQGDTAQRDFDGTRLVSDLLHDETVLHLADVLAERDDGFIQLTHSRVEGPNTEFFELLAQRSGRPVLFNTVVSRPGYPEMHRSRLEWLAECRRKGLPVYGQGITDDGGYTFSLDEWNLFDERDAWREATVGTVQERLAKLSDPARRPELRAQRP